jgi:hypothetical protein
VLPEHFLSNLNCKFLSVKKIVSFYKNFMKMCKVNALKPKKNSLNEMLKEYPKVLIIKTQ